MSNRQIFLFFGSLASLFLLALVGFYFYGRQLSKEYPMLETSDTVHDTIAAVFDDGRGAARVTAKGGTKFTLPWAKNLAYENYDFTRFVAPGDILQKKQQSDTIYVTRNGDRYFFVAFKTIDPRKP
jgi:hypothetical protein